MTLGADSVMIFAAFVWSFRKEKLMGQLLLGFVFGGSRRCREWPLLSRSTVHDWSDTFSLKEQQCPNFSTVLQAFAATPSVCFTVFCCVNVTVSPASKCPITFPTACGMSFPAKGNKFLTKYFLTSRREDWIIAYNGALNSILRLIKSQSLHHPLFKSNKHRTSGVD